MPKTEVRVRMKENEYRTKNKQPARVIGSKTSILQDD